MQSNTLKKNRKEKEIIHLKKKQSQEEYLRR